MASGPYFQNGSELKNCRIKLRWTQKQLALKAGVHVQTVKYHERRTSQLDGVAPARFRKILALASSSLPDLPKRHKAPIDHRPVVQPGPVLSTAAQRQCEAMTRNGSPCKAKAIEGRTRCKIHGGLSTGPKTTEGRERVSLAQSRRWERYRQSKQSPE